MLTFRVTRDAALIERLLKEPACWVRMRNDAAPPAEDFAVVPDDRITFVVAREDGRSVAIFLLVDQGNAAEVHFCFRPSAWGSTEEVSREFLRWVWVNTRYGRLVGAIPSYNLLAKKLALKVGFTQFGIQKRAGKKHGKHFDLLLTEVRRPSNHE